MKMTVSAAATTVAMAGSESPSRSFGLREKFGKLHLFSVDRTNRWPVQGWSSGDESHHKLDEQFVAEESTRAFTLDKETRWPLQGWCKAHKPFNSTEDESAMSSHLWASSRWPQVGEVTEIHLAGLGLNGTITTQIGNLVHLQYLNCSGNSLWGPIPELGSCKELATLDLSVNSLNGNLYPKMFTLPNLEELVLLNSSFSGPLPEVAQNGCRSMTTIWIDYANISGTLPSSLSRCRNLTELRLECNQLNGSVPAS